MSTQANTNAAIDSEKNISAGNVSNELSALLDSLESTPKQQKKPSNQPQKKIPLMRPLLPPAEAILPYLKEIDANRWYSNFGPLSFRFEERLAALFGVPSSCLMTVSNGTSALSVLLQALNVQSGTVCVMPSWTFAATAAAAIEVGMTPHFVDVNEQSWILEPDALKQQLPLIPGKVGAVMVVSTFGTPVPVAAWDAFTAETGIPVIIDGAAAFDTLLQVPEAKLGNTPVMVSLHATKSIGIGEGGFVICNNKPMLHKARQLCNFGFSPSREIVLPGVNCKLSEYSAAVGLAALDDWPNKRARWEALTHWYLDAFERATCSAVSPWLNRHWISSVCNVRVPISSIENLVEQLSYSGIEARRWWIRACHQQPAFRQHPRFALPVTEKLVDSVIALPFSVDMTEAEVNYVVNRFVNLF
jgi:dTDP-4-amino-4,6-dideoxygalactose transaminase